MVNNEPGEVIEFEKGETLTPATIFDLLEDSGGIVHRGYGDYEVGINFKIIIMS